MSLAHAGVVSLSPSRMMETPEHSPTRIELTSLPALTLRHDRRATRSARTPGPQFDHHVSVF